jgi:hypothetical protein
VRPAHGDLDEAATGPHRDPAVPAWFPWGLAGLAACLAAIAVLGPLVTGVLRYRYSRTMLDQAVGLDAFALVVVVPLLLAVAVLAARRHPAAPLLALGPAGFASYMLVQYVIGPEYLTVGGNGERGFPLFAAAFALSGAVLLQAWALARAPVPESGRQRRRRGTALLGLAVLVVGGMYLANGFADAVRDFPAFVQARAASSEYGEHPTAYWLVAFLDLAVVVPLTVATAVGLLRGSRWADRAFYGVVGWFALVPGSVAAMAVVMVARDDPAADARRASAFVATALVLAVLAGRVLVPLVRVRAPAARADG